MTPCQPYLGPRRRLRCCLTLGGGIFEERLVLAVAGYLGVLRVANGISFRHICTLYLHWGTREVKCGVSCVAVQALHPGC